MMMLVEYSKANCHLTDDKMTSMVCWKSQGHDKVRMVFWRVGKALEERVMQFGRDDMFSSLLGKGCILRTKLRDYWKSEAIEAIVHFGYVVRVLLYHYT